MIHMQTEMNWPLYTNIIICTAFYLPFNLFLFSRFFVAVDNRNVCKSCVPFIWMEFFQIYFSFKFRFQSPNLNIFRLFVHEMRKSTRWTIPSMCSIQYLSAKRVPFHICLSLEFRSIMVYWCELCNWFQYLLVPPVVFRIQWQITMNEWYHVEIVYSFNSMNK